MVIIVIDIIIGIIIKGKEANSPPSSCGYMLCEFSSETWGGSHSSWLT